LTASVYPGNTRMEHYRLAGYDAREFGGHSLRSGFVTTAGRQGVNLGDTMALSGHSGATVALRYHQAGAALSNPAARLAD
jgi:integrase